MTVNTCDAVSLLHSVGACETAVIVICFVILLWKYFIGVY